ncbi:MAG: hypothetical protein HYX47_10460 [Burkholderiales bacterium]|nr:hypothetical protein [Burkholderiales bacterium]
MTFSPTTGPEARRHELLADIAERIAQRLIEKHGMEQDAACNVGNDLADFLADKWKGQTFYFPADQSYRLNQRDWIIFQRMERGEAPELALEFGLTTVRIHQIYKRALLEFRARNQHTLFPADSLVDDKGGHHVETASKEGDQ